MDEARFDDLARAFASSLSRRRALGVMIGAALAGAFGNLKFARAAALPCSQLSQPACCSYCNSLFPNNATQALQCYSQWIAHRLGPCACQAKGGGLPCLTSPGTSTAYVCCQPPSNPCMTSTCPGGVCNTAPVPNGRSCSGPDKCQTYSCQNGSCTGASRVCTPIDQCHAAGACDSSTGTCSNPPVTNGTPCKGSTNCRAYTCQAGVCTDGGPLVCTPSDQCHVAGTCNPATGKCSNPNAPNGTSCDDGNLCTLNDTCQNGVCIGSASVVCTPLDQCHVAGVCDPATGQCSNPNAPNGRACDDGDPCTTNDVCTNGVCAGTPVACPVCKSCSGGICVNDADNTDCASTPPSKCCSGNCTDITTTANCGTCGMQCTGTTPACCNTSDGYLCKDLNIDLFNCGSCGHVCSGAVLAEAACCSGGCADLLHDKDNCGACGTTCTTGTTPACCPGTPSGVCTDLSNDLQNCGACSVHCDTSVVAHSATVVCQSGTCVATSCITGYTLMPDGTCCLSGNVCGTGASATCCTPPAGTCCGGKCVDTSVDPNNCGGCARACPQDVSCAGSTCAQGSFGGVCNQFADCSYTFQSCPPPGQQCGEDGCDACLNGQCCIPHGQSCVSGGITFQGACCCDTTKSCPSVGTCP
jgi:hypothetical protein